MAFASRMFLMGVMPTYPLRPPIIESDCFGLWPDGLLNLQVDGVFTDSIASEMPTVSAIKAFFHGELRTVTSRPLPFMPEQKKPQRHFAEAVPVRPLKPGSHRARQLPCWVKGYLFSLDEGSSQCGAKPVAWVTRDPILSYPKSRRCVRPAFGIVTVVHGR